MTQQFPKNGPSPWDSTAKRLWRRARPTKLTSGLVGLSSAAIVSVYAVGYFNTQSAENELLAAAPAVSSATSAPPTAVPPSTSTVPRSVSSSGQALPQPTATRTPAAASGQPGAVAASYKDGTYVGSGNSRHGGITATVIVSGGQIVSADITNCGTRYPCSKVAALPPRVLATQAAPSVYISGATDSSAAYTTAIRNALAQATVA